ncbi:GNAT family N-acetyltransferase [Ilumatobacter sp.]|uniref:GNAT family N-acetyltransferase n=1 Tax=Ilumatobacter sp. TaxID=1967498 RepID=UPI003C347E64
MIEIRVPVADDLDAIFRRDSEAFGGSFTAEQRIVWTELLDLDRFRAAFDGDTLVGFAGSHELEITLPGAVVVPMAGTTWVSVAATHRRQGILRRLIDAVHADIDERGEPIAGLQASEAGIYERFGYGAATSWRHIEIDRRRVEFSDRFQPSPGGLTLIDPLVEVDRLAEIYDRYRRGQVGEVSRSPAWIRMRMSEGSRRRAGVLHRDGYAIWTITENWSEFDARHELCLDDLVACTDEARAALWNLVLSHDLVGPVRSDRSVALDDPLASLLTNPRAVKTTALHDFLWLCPRRVGDLLAARRYRDADALVVDVDGERWRVEGGIDGAVSVRTNVAPDLTMTRAAMGALLLGGVSATELAAERRLIGDDLARADVFFGWMPAPHCTTPF